MPATPWYQRITPKYSDAYAATIGLKNALVMARAGFTTVRDLGSQGAAGIAMRDAIARRQLSRARASRCPAPRCRSSAAMRDDAVGLPPELAAAIDDAHLSSVSAPASTNASGRCARSRRTGVDVIKIMATGGVLDPGAMGLEQHFTDAEMKAIVDMPIRFI